MPSDKLVADEEGDLALSEHSESRETAEDSLIKELRLMGITTAKHFNPKRENTFKTWFEQTEFHLNAIKLLDEDKTTSHLLPLDLNSFNASKHLRIKCGIEYLVAKKTLKHYFAIT